MDIIFHAKNVRSEFSEVSKERFSQLFTQFMAQCGYTFDGTATYENEPLMQMETANPGHLPI